MVPSLRAWVPQLAAAALAATAPDASVDTPKDSATVLGDAGPSASAAVATDAGLQDAPLDGGLAGAPAVDGGTATPPAEAVVPVPAEPEEPPLLEPPEPIPGANFRLEPMAHQRVAFKVKHPFRTTVGISHDLQGVGRVLDDGTVQVMVRVPIDSLDTGNAAENEHTVEVLQPLAYPSVTIRALVKPSIPVPAGWNNPDDTLEVATDSTAAMQISLHGVTKTLEQVPVHLIYEPHGKIRVSGSFSIDLTEFKVPLPRFYFIKIERTVDLQFDLLWQPQQRAKG